MIEIYQKKKNHLIILMILISISKTVYYHTNLIENLDKKNIDNLFRIL